MVAPRKPPLRAPAGTGRFQVGSFPNAALARNVVKVLDGHHLGTALVEQAFIGAEPWHRVVLTGFSRRESARRMARDLRDRLRISPVLIEWASDARPPSPCQNPTRSVTAPPLSAVLRARTRDSLVFGPRRSHELLGRGARRDESLGTNQGPGAESIPAARGQVPTARLRAGMWRPALARPPLGAPAATERRGGRPKKSAARLSLPAQGLGAWSRGRSAGPTDLKPKP